MKTELDYLNGRRFCVVFVKVLDEEAGRVQLQALHGRANVDRGRLQLRMAGGAAFTVPQTALPNVLPSDGTDILKDAEYYVLVKTDENIQFLRSDEQ